MLLTNPSLTIGEIADDIDDNDKEGEVIEINQKSKCKCSKLDWKSIYTCMVLLTFGYVFSILAVCINILDACVINSFTIEFGIFGIGGIPIYDSNYWDDCSDDKLGQGNENPSCSFEWRGLFWLIFVILNWIIYLITVIIFFAKKCQFGRHCCCCINNNDNSFNCIATRKAISKLIIICIAMIIFGIMSWDVDNTGVEMYLEIDNERTYYTCRFEMLGASNWLLSAAVVFASMSIIYGCCCAKEQAFTNKI